MWQQIYEEVGGPDFELIAVAVDPSGADAPRRYVEAASATFPVLVDAGGVSSVAFGFQVVPNGILVDRDGTIRYRKDGGFSNVNAADRDAVTAFARGGEPGPGPKPGRLPYVLGPLERELVAARMELGQLLASMGRHDDAIAQWQLALRLDPENRTIRKAIWAARYPERFHPTIDSAWQVEQRERERAEEIAAGICGPDGCPIPGAALR